MLRRTRFAFLFATTLASAACATDGGDAGTGGGAGGKADGETASITFGDDWSETVRGELVAGSPVRISYDLDRLQDCRGSTNGSEVWGVSGYASFDGGEPVTFGLSRLDGGVVKAQTADLEIPASATSVELWFSINNRWGCIAYDSNENANYAFDVAASPTGPVLSFEADYSESQSGALRAGSQAVVHYEPARLAQCAASSGGNAKWSVTMHYKVDGGSVKTMLVTRAQGSELVPSDAAFTVPRGRDLEVWFSATNVYGCNAYDSNLGGNYHYSIE
jgi:hypothetical protein